MKLICKKENAGFVIFLVSVSHFKTQNCEASKSPYL